MMTYYYLIVTILSLISEIVSVTANSFKSVKERLIGYPVRGAVYNYSPIMEAVKRGKNVTYKGPGMELMDMLTKHFKIDLILIPARESEINRVGFNTALYNLIINKEVDLVSYPFQRTMEYADYIEFTYPIWILPYTFLQAWPKEENTRLTATIRPFAPPVWWFFLILTVALVVVLGVTNFVRQKTSKRTAEGQRLATVWWHINQSFDYVVSVILNQGNKNPSTPWVSFYILVGLWLLSLVVLVNAYTGTITAFLTVPKLKPTISTIEELAASDNRMLVVEPDTDFYYKCVNAAHGPYKIVGDTLRNNPDNALHDGSFTNIFDKIINHDCIYPTVGVLAEYMVHVDYKLNGRCRMTTAAKSLHYYAHMAMPMTKGAFYYEAFSENFMLRLCEGGIVDSWRKTYFMPLALCHAERAPRDHNLAVIKLIDFQAVFLLLGIGIGLSSIVFCLEWLISWMSSIFLERY